jgi:hypothetical protein
MVIDGFEDIAQNLYKQGLCEMKPVRKRGLSVVLCNKELVLVNAVWEVDPVIMLIRP